MSIILWSHAKEIRILWTLDETKIALCSPTILVLCVHIVMNYKVVPTVDVLNKNAQKIGS